MPFECRIRINAVKAYDRFDNASIGSHPVSWRVLGTAQREFVSSTSEVKIMTLAVHGSYSKLLTKYDTQASRC